MNKHFIYADNATTTRLDSEAYTAMQPFLLGNFGNASALYSLARSTKNALEQSRESVAECIGALPEEIFFTSGGSESNNWAIKGFSFIHSFSHIITSQIEHPSILNSCKFIEDQGRNVSYLNVDKKGIVHEEALAQCLQHSIKTLVSIMLANNEIGTIQDIAMISNLAHRNGAVFHCDAVQGIGHIPVNVNTLGADMLSASAHKFNGPKGVGFLFIRNGIKISPLISGGSQEYWCRAGTENVAGIVAMATALRTNCEHMVENKSKLSNITSTLINCLRDSKLDFLINGSSNRLPGSISISIRNISGELLMHRLDLQGICVSTGAACKSSSKEISHVIRAIDVPTEYANGTIRLSFGKENCTEDAIVIAKSVIKICNK